MRHKPRLDANHKEVVDAFKALGCKVLSLAGLGGGVPDILISTGQHLAICEIKNGKLPPSARGLTVDQIRWHANWSGRIWTIENLEQVAECVAYYKKDKQC